MHRPRRQRWTRALAMVSGLCVLLTAVLASGVAVASRAGAGGSVLRVGPGQAAEANRWHPAGRAPDYTGGKVFAGLRKSDRCRGGFEVERSNGACSHGPDDAPPAVDVTEIPTLTELTAEAVAADGTTDGAVASGSVPCYGDGVSGKRVQVIYAVASDRTDRYSSVVELIRGYAWNLDQAFYNSAQRDGGVRHVRFVTDSSCQLDVDHVVLSPTGDDSIGNTRTELRNLGFGSMDRKYLVFADAGVYCGISFTAGDDRPDSSNPANSGATVSRVDAGCWGGTNSVPAHELAHALGAVQLTAPHSNGAWHCTDEYDRLCYDDGSGSTMTHLCASSEEPLLDCNGDDYFNVAPVAGSWLATHWNLANSMFLDSVEPSAALSSSPAPTTTTPTPTPTPTTATPTPTPAPPTTATPTPTPSTTATPSPTPMTSTSSPTPMTSTSSRTLTAGKTKGPRKPRRSTVFQGRITAGETSDTYRFYAGKGRLATAVRSAGAGKVIVTVKKPGGWVVLHSRGRVALQQGTRVRAGRYVLRVSGSVGLRYSVKITRGARGAI